VGNTYFSLWDALPKRALYGQGPAPCVARVTPEGVLDEGWHPNLLEWTGGRHTLVFRYARDGKALGNVLHHEELGVSFEGPTTPRSVPRSTLASTTACGSSTCRRSPPCP
jgi:hypothetical protein